MNVVTLARWQFGITTVYHFFMVPLTIGLALTVAYFQTRWYRSGDDAYLRLTKFFGKLFLINFAMGVVTGIVQEFQFGMNWATYSRFVGDVFGAPLAIEALVAFFLESTFLGLWIFGWGRLSPRLHLATIWAAAIGTTLSAYFIVAANSWMQHPVGVKFNPDTGRAELIDIGKVLTNSTTLAAYPHVIAGSLLTAAVFVGGVSAWLLMRNRPMPAGDATALHKAVRTSIHLTFAMGIAVAVSGDYQARLMFEQQPMKMAAAEALCDTETGRRALGVRHRRPRRRVRRAHHQGAEAPLVHGHRLHHRHRQGRHRPERRVPGQVRPRRLPAEPGHHLLELPGHGRLRRHRLVRRRGGLVEDPQGPRPAHRQAVGAPARSPSSSPRSSPTRSAGSSPRWGANPGWWPPTPTASPRSGCSPPTPPRLQCRAPWSSLTLVGFALVYGALMVVELGLPPPLHQRPAPTRSCPTPDAADRTSHDDPGRRHRTAPRPRPDHHRRPRGRRAGLRLLIGTAMELTTFWFILLGVLWTGYFFLEGFDFGVGMLLHPLSRNETERRVLINTIGPVWDGNEVWLLTAGGATFAAFPNWYATLFSGFYLALFLILVALILRGVAFEYRGKVDSDTVARRRWDLAIAFGSWVPAVLWGVAFANIVHGRAHQRRRATSPAPCSPCSTRSAYWAGWSPRRCSCSTACTSWRSRPRARSTTGPRPWPSRSLRSPSLAGASFLIWNQLDRGSAWTWAPVLVAAVAPRGLGAGHPRRPRRAGRSWPRGWPSPPRCWPCSDRCTRT